MAPKFAIGLRHPRERQPVPIVSEAAIMSRGIADGKLLPLIILDTRERPDIDDVVTAHQNPDASGDVNASWLKPSWLDRSEMRLLLEFVQPVACVVIVAFELRHYAGFVDQIVQNEGLYIQPGRPGDRLKNTLAAPRMIVEVNCDFFRPFWEPIFLREAAKKLRRDGMRVRDAKTAAPQFVQEWRAFTTKQMAEYGADNAREPGV
jgi:hypothetical protein